MPVAPLNSQEFKSRNRAFVLRALLLATLIGLVAYYGWVKPFRSRLSDVDVVVKQP